MDPMLRSESPLKSDVKPSFRKPSNDAANRKYRRHSPVGGSDSPSSGGSPNRGRSHSPAYSMGDRKKMHNDHRRRNDGRELERGSSRYHSSRGSDSHRHSDRSTYESSHESRRHNSFNQYSRHADDEGKSYQRFSQSGRDSRSGSRYDNTGQDGNSNRSRDNWRDVDKHARDQNENSRHKTKEKEREAIVPEDHKHKDRTSEKAVSGSRQIYSSRTGDVKSGERARHKDSESRDDRRDHHLSPDHKNDHESSHDSIRGRDGGVHRSDRRIINNEVDGKKEKFVHKGKHEGKEMDKHKDNYSREPKEEMASKIKGSSTCRERDGKYDRYADKTISLTGDQNSSAKRLKLGHSEGDEKPSSSSKQVSEAVEMVSSKPVNSIPNQHDPANGIDAAKVAAIKAAELVNRNLVGGVGGSYLSTDQKKKLLWGNKKSTTAAEPANRWGLQLFSDGERQEKFNKLMTLRLPWYLWPIVGCEGGCCGWCGAEARRQGPGREAEGAEHGLGEAVHRRAQAKRWPDRRSRSVVCFSYMVRERPSSAFFLSSVSFSCTLVLWMNLLIHQLCWELLLEI